MSIAEWSREQRKVARYFPQAVLMPHPHLTGLPARLGVFHRGYIIEPRFTADFPFSPPRIYLTPAPASRHYYIHPGEDEPRLCWIRDEEWSPRLGLVVAVCSAMRFINDYMDRRVD